MIDLPDIIKATCPVHGAVEFWRVMAANLWACSVGKDPGCSSAILEESMTPDGGDVIVMCGQNGGPYRHPNGQHDELCMRLSKASPEWLKMKGLL